MILFPIVIFCAYLIGSVSSAIIVCRLMRLPDPRQHGSNNPGATNVMRLGGKKAAAFVFVGDALKGVIATTLAYWVFNMAPWLMGFVALAVVAGHIFPCFHEFKGGKGVATTAGCAIGMGWPLVLGFAVLWIGLYKWKGYASIASLAATASLPLVSLWYAPGYSIGLCILTLLVVWAHRENIQRLCEGEELRP